LERSGTHHKCYDNFRTRGNISDNKFSTTDLADLSLRPAAVGPAAEAKKEDQARASSEIS
jgi:hypothetical protein